MSLLLMVIGFFFDIASLAVRLLTNFNRLFKAVVQRILTNSEVHPRGIKVMLEGGIAGRVKEIK